MAVVRARRCVIGVTAVLAAAAAAAAVAGGPASAAAASPRAGLPLSARAVAYRPVDLGTLGGAHSRAVALNDRGQVAGISQTAAGVERVFRWSAGVMTDLGFTGEPVAINAAGQIAGGRAGHGDAGFFWSDGVLTDIGSLGDSFAHVVGLNDLGQVIGTSDTEDRDEHAFVWARGVMTDIGPPDFPLSVPVGINNRGEVVGYAEDPRQGRAGFSFRWRNGVRTVINSPVCQGFRPTAINDRGDVLGWGSHDGTFGLCLLGGDGTAAQLPPGMYQPGASLNNLGQVAATRGYPDMRAVVLRPGAARILGAPPGWSTSAVDINDLGQVAGYGGGAAIAWNSGQATLLPSAGWAFPSVAQINNRGQIAGTVYRPDASHAVVWQPVFATESRLPPPPAPCAPTRRQLAASRSSAW
jgi:probable HAF family extracellular repeat protein